MTETDLVRFKEHYDIEKELAQMLRDSERPERQSLYYYVYSEVAKRVPYHPMLITNADLNARLKSAMSQFAILKRYINKEAIFLEIAPGDGALVLYAAPFFKKVIALDIAKKIDDKNSASVDNFELIIYDGVNIDLPENSIDIIYSHQLMEHLHPEDAVLQLKCIANALKLKGSYICTTPHRFSGPHDVSKYFDRISKGLHLKEYTNRELFHLFKYSGFSRIEFIMKIKKRSIVLPSWAVISIEILVEIFPYGLRKFISSSKVFRALLGIIIVGTK